MVNFFINNVRQLLEHDSGEVLLDTLEQLYCHNAEPGKTSLLLGIHRNTLTHRLQQIKSIYSSIRWLHRPDAAGGVGTLLSPAESAPERMD